MLQEMISVGLLTYNHERYVEDALRGLISQQYKEIELILLDDASTDRTISVIDTHINELRERFVHVKQIVHKKNTGSISGNVNEMIRAADGKYIHIISGDDIMTSCCTQCLADELNTHPDCMVAFGNMYIVEDGYQYGDPPPSELYHPDNIPSCVMPDNLFQVLMTRGSIIASPTAMCRREVFERYGYHDETIPVEDYEYWLRLSVDAKFYYIQEPLVYYRRADSSFTNYSTPQKKKRLDAMIDADYRTKKKYLHLLSEEDQKMAMCALIKNYVAHCLNSGYQQGIEKLYDLMEQEGLSIDDLE